MRSDELGSSIAAAAARLILAGGVATCAAVVDAPKVRAACITIGCGGRCIRVGPSKKKATPQQPQATPRLHRARGSTIQGRPAPIAEPKPKRKTAAVPPPKGCPQYPTGDIDTVAPKKSAAEAALRCGMLVEHIEKLASLTGKKHWVAIVRETNPMMKRWFADSKVLPKPLKIKTNTGANGKFLEGGQEYHSDYDLMGLYQVLANGAVERVMADPDDFANRLDPLLEQMNDTVVGKAGKRMFQHGPQDAYLKVNVGNPNQAGNVTFDPIRQPGDQENFLVAEEDGTIRVICGSVNLKRYYQLKGIPWPYG